MAPKSSPPATAGSLVPAPWALLGFVLLGTAAVLDLPSLGARLPAGDRGDPTAAQAAATGAAVLLFTAGYLALARATEGLARRWATLTFAWCSGIALIKFGVSPASFDNAPGTTLAEYVRIGIVVMLLYCAALWAVYSVARRNRHPRRWSLESKLGLLAGIVAFALVSRYLAALALGTGSGTGEYLARVFGATGLFLLVLLAAVTALAIESFDTLARVDDAAGALRSGLVAGVAVVVTYHGLWALFMVRQFG